MEALKDKEKTPVAAATIADKNAASNVISRLESKYSDILDRVAKRKEKQRQEDRDKTLEPDNVRMPAPLMKSSTTANVMKSSGSLHQPKERTPFRVERNKNKYGSDSKNTGSNIGVLF